MNTYRDIFEKTACNFIIVFNFFLSMKYLDFMGSLHKSTPRDYLSRVNDKEFPKAKAAKLAKKFDFDYWDGDRRICWWRI